MAIVLNTAPELEKAITEAAAQRGMSAEQFALEAVQERIEQPTRRRSLSSLRKYADIEVSVDSYLTHKAEDKARGDF